MSTDPPARSPADPPPGLDPRPLGALTVAVTSLAALGALPRWPGLLHLVALPPLDLVTDLSLVFTEATGIPTFVAGTLLALAVRSVVLAGLLGRLDRAGLWLALRFQLVVLPVALLAAGVRFSANAVLFYLLFWIAAALTLALFAVTAAAPWSATDRLRAGFASAARQGFRLGTLGAYVIALTLLGAVADAGGDVAAVLLVPVSAALTWGAAVVLREPHRMRVLRRSLAVVPAAGLVAFAVVVLTGPAAPPEALTPAEPRAGSILLMSGIDSSSGSGAILEIDPATLGWTCDEAFHFSYAGPGDGQPRNDARCPIDHGAPYGPEDSLRSVDEQVAFLEAQVAEMPTPVVVAGHSQGAWHVWAAAAEDRLPGTEVVVLVGAFPQNPAPYPTLGDSGPGRVGRMFLELVEAIPRPGGTTVFDADSPLGQEWLGDPDAIEQLLARPLPDGIRALSIPSAFDLPLMPDGHRIDGATDACPVGTMHPNLPYDPELHEVLVAFLDDEPLPGCAWWRDAIGPTFRHLAGPPGR